jgi:hypothetical protein
MYVCFSNMGLSRASNRGTGTRTRGRSIAVIDPSPIRRSRPGSRRICFAFAFWRLPRDVSFLSQTKRDGDGRGRAGVAAAPSRDMERPSWSSSAYRLAYMRLAPAPAVSLIPHLIFYLPHASILQLGFLFHVNFFIFQVFFIKIGIEFC